MLNIIVMPSPPTGRSSCYVAPALLADVLFDQLEHLVSHLRQTCPPTCRDCARLTQVQHLLLAPFDSEGPTDVAFPIAA
jgi:hypothetical protein